MKGIYGIKRAIF